MSHWRVHGRRKVRVIYQKERKKEDTRDGSIRRNVANAKGAPELSYDPKVTCQERQVSEWPHMDDPMFMELRVEFQNPAPLAGHPLVMRSTSRHGYPPD